MPSQTTVQGKNRMKPEGNLTRLGMATITKKEIMDRIADDLNGKYHRSPMKRVQVKRVVQRLLDMIVEELAKGNRLEFREFGVFESRHCPPRLAQNPKTLEKVPVPARRTMKFKAGRVMREKVAFWPSPTD